MKVKTKYGWFDMSDIFHISNLEIDWKGHYDSYPSEKLIKCYYFETYSKYESVIKKIYLTRRRYDNFFDKNTQNKINLLFEEYDGKIQDDKFEFEINKLLKEDIEIEYNNFVNMWLNNK